MSLRIEFLVECPKCTAMASAGVTEFVDYDHVPGEVLQLDLELSAAQLTFRCQNPTCAAECYSGDYEVYSDDS